MMASAEMQELQDHIVVCDRYLVSTAARRIASEHVDAPELIRDLLSWTWPSTCINQR